MVCDFRFVFLMLPYGICFVDTSIFILLSVRTAVSTLIHTGVI